MYDIKLKTLLKVEETGSFTKASEELYLSTVSVMKHINQLEKEIGVKIFVRSPHGVKLTPAGRSICQDARRVITFCEHAAIKARDLEKPRHYTIRIAASMLHPHRELLDFWNRMNMSDLPFRFQMIPFCDHQPDMEQMLSSLGDQIDCFFGPCDSSFWHQKYNVLLLKASDCCIGVPRTHPLASRKTLQWEDLSYENLLLPGHADSPVYNRMRQTIEQDHPLIQLVNVDGLYDMRVFNQCSERNDLMVIPDIWKDVHPEIITLPMNWKYQMPCGLIYSKTPTEAMKNFASLLSEHVLVNSYAYNPINTTRQTGGLL